MDKKERRGSLLHRQPGSRNWNLDITFPSDIDHPLHRYHFGGKRRFKRSMGTPDFRLAEINAADLVAKYRIIMFSHRQKREYAMAVAKWATLEKPEDALHLLQKTPDKNEEVSFPRQYPDGLQTIDGQQAYVDGATVNFLDHKGLKVRTGENPVVVLRTIHGITDRQDAGAFLNYNPEIVVPKKFRPKPPNPDDAIIERYITHAGLKGFLEREARAMWVLYKEIVDVPLEKASAEDGRKIVSHLEAKGNMRGTIQKKIGWLNAAVNHDINTNRDSKLRFNPFSHVLPKKKREDEVKRPPLSEDDMEACYKHMDSLSETDQLLWFLLAKTGMRLSEAFEIEKDEIEAVSKIRYVRVGSKTDQSDRRIPLPDHPLLPKRITGPLFQGGSPAASKRLNRFIDRALGDGSSVKVVHSLRHRMKDILRQFRATKDVQNGILGHEDKTVADGYGRGLPMKDLLPYIEAVTIDGTAMVAP